MITKENLYMKAINIIVPYKKVSITLSNGVDNWTFEFGNGNISKIEKKLPPSWPFWITDCLFLVVETWLDKELFQPKYLYDDPLKALRDFHINKLLWLEYNTENILFLKNTRIEFLTKAI